jgi:hypothetical protein
MGANGSIRIIVEAAWLGVAGRGQAGPGLARPGVAWHGSQWLNKIIGWGVYGLTARVGVGASGSNGGHYVVSGQRRKCGGA